MARSPSNNFHPLRRAACLLLLFLAGARADSMEQVTNERAAALFAWIDQLPLPKTKDLKPIRIWTGGPWQNENGKAVPLTCLGFLIEDGDKEFRAISADGALEVFTKKQGTPETLGFVGFQEIPFADQVRELIAKPSAPGKIDRFLPLYGFNSDRLKDCSRLFLLARWAEERDDHALAMSLLQILQESRQGEKADQRPEPLETQLQEEFGERLSIRTLRLIAEKGVERSTVLERLREIVALCPEAKLSEAKAAIALLEKMVAEDEAHRAVTESELASMPPAERAKELIFRLRDECTRMAPPNQSPFRAAHPAEPSPSNGAANALSELGLDAVPALLKALDEESFTRELSDLQFGSRQSIVPVRSIALRVLMRISGCSFKPDTRLGIPRKILARYADAEKILDEEFDEKVRLVSAHAWASGVTEKGEKAFLIDSLRTGDPNSQYAKRLLDKYPDEVIPAIIDAARNRPDINDRLALQYVLAKQKDPRCQEFFADELIRAHELGDRLEAAQFFQDLHDPRGLAAMRAEWKKMKAEPTACAKMEFDPDPSPNDPTGVIRFLFNSGDSEAILALDDSASLPVEWRAKIIETLFAGSWPARADGPNKVTAKVCEDLLVGYLGDSANLERTPFRPGYWRDSPLPAGRVCDAAAASLHARWPDKYAFDQWLPLAARDRQCIAAANVRRKETGETPQTLPPESEANEPVPGRAASIVAVDCDPSPPKDRADLSAKLIALRNTPMSSGPLISALASSVTSLPPKVTGFTLTLSRFRDLSGITIHFRYTLGETPPPNTKCHLRIFREADKIPPTVFNAYATVKGNGELGPADWTNPELWQPLAKVIDAVGSTPDTAFSIVAEFSIRQVVMLSKVVD